MSTQEEIRLETDNTNLRVLLVQAGLDREEQDTAKRLMRVLFDELHHRLKNNLAIITAIVRQSLKSADSLEHGRQAVETRLNALGRAHDVLMQADFTSAKMASIINAAIEPFARFGAEQFLLDIADREVRESAVLPITLILNELCTNATKYGALSVGAGNVRIRQISDDTAQTVHLVWEERSGPAVATPTRRGFGTRLIDALVSQISGHVTLTYDVSGFSCVLKIPMAALNPQPELPQLDAA